MNVEQGAGVFTCEDGNAQKERERFHRFVFFKIQIRIHLFVITLNQR